MEGGSPPPQPPYQGMSSASPPPNEPPEMATPANAAVPEAEPSPTPPTSPATNAAPVPSLPPKPAPAVTAPAPSHPAAPPLARKPKKPKKRKDPNSKEDGGRKKPRKTNRARNNSTALENEGLTPAQMAAQEQMRRALEEDKYSAAGSIVNVDSDDDAQDYDYRGSLVRLERPALLQAVRKHHLLERLAGIATSTTTSSKHSNNNHKGPDEQEEDDLEDDSSRKSKKKKKRKTEAQVLLEASKPQTAPPSTSKDPLALDSPEDDLNHDGGSIFGATQGSSNSIWVECDKCKKWRRLRGVVDEKKLPSKWYCSMNKNDPERARCSAPEEEYETPQTPESKADALVRKHLRVWTRRLQCNEAYEARQPTLTRGKKRSATSTSKDPYEWIRCCNPSCGKWRMVLRSMEAKTVIERSSGEWYCVMNVWDEKVASCAAPQENLPAVGCPPWVMRSD